MKDEDILIRPLKLEALKKELELRIQRQQQVDAIFKPSKKNTLFSKLKSLLNRSFF